MIRFAALLVLALLLTACTGDDDAGDAAGPTPSVTSVSTPRPGSTAVPNATVKPTIAIDSFDPALQLKGVFRPAQDTAVTPLELPERPKAEFAAWDGVSVVLYDTQTGQSHNFGPGSLAQPAFGGGYLVYTSSDSEVVLVDLETMEKEPVARGILAYFLGEKYIVINPGNNSFYGIDVETRKRVELSEIREPVLASMVSQRWGGGFLAEWQDNRFAIRLAENPQSVCENTGPEQRACLAEVSSKWLIEDLWNQNTVMAFEANKVASAGPTEIVIATTPVCYEAGWITDCFEVLSKLEAQTSGSGVSASVEGTTNIFLVDLKTGEATFVATATYNASTGRWPMNWPLVANDRIVAWTESYCGEPRGATRIYNRDTGQIAALNRSDWLTLANNRLGLGEQGATTVLDPLSLQYLAVLPELSGVNWSEDLRYAAVGQGLGRGALCE